MFGITPNYTLGDSSSNNFKIKQYYEHPFRVINFFKFKKFTINKQSILTKFSSRRDQIHLTIRDDVDDSALVIYKGDTIINSYLRYEPSAGINRVSLNLKIDSINKLDNYLTMYLVNKKELIKFIINPKYDTIMVYYNEKYKIWTIKHSYKHKKPTSYM
jgi:hypothetical protein